MECVKDNINVTDSNLEEMRKSIVDKYFELNLIENTASNKNYIVVSKEDYDDWD